MDEKDHPPRVREAGGAPMTSADLFIFILFGVVSYHVGYRDGKEGE